MTFKPINDDHAVQSVTASVLFDKPLSANLINHLQGNHHKWLPELPAMRTPQVVSFEIGSGKSEPQRTDGHGVEFSFLRPDGTPAWLLRMDGNAIHVECTRYTRWERVWGSAKSHILTALELIADFEQQDELHAVATTLQYVDRFVGAPKGNDFRVLFVDNPFLAQAVFDLGDAWHSHTGWFDDSIEFGRTLNNLNVDAKTEVVRGEPRTMIGLLHLQQFRYSTPPTAKGFFEEQEKLLDGLMQQLHSENKKLIASLLTDEMGNTIGITTTESRA